MLKKIRSLVLNYDKRFWEWLEGESNPRPRSNRQTVDPVKPRSTKSGRSMDDSKQLKMKYQIRRD